MFQRTRLRKALMALLPAGALLAGTGATPAMADATFKILNRSGIGDGDVRFYYLGYGTLGKDFVVLGADGKWIIAGRDGSGWNSFAWNPNAGKNKEGKHNGAGLVPCHPLTARSTVTIPPHLAGSRVYFFQVRKGTPLFDKPCGAAVDPKPETVKGIFGNVLVPGKSGQAPFSYFSKKGNGDLTGPSIAAVVQGSLPLWTYSELGASATVATIDTSQVDFIGFPMNVTAKMTGKPARSVPELKAGVGVSFSPKSEVNASDMVTSYNAFANRLPETSQTGATKIETRQNYKNLTRKTPSGTMLINPGNYISFVNPSSFGGFFGNIMNNYMWKPGWKGSIRTGGAFGPTGSTLPDVTFAGTTKQLTSFDGKTPPAPLHAIRFTATVNQHSVVAYLISPTSYQALCNAGFIKGCGPVSPAYQVFAAAGALTTPIDDKQFMLLSASEQATWNTYFGGPKNYKKVVSRLGFIVSMAYNHGVAGGLQTKDGLCAGRVLSACWSDQSLWYPNPRPGTDLKKLYFTGDTTQNEFSRWLHTATIAGLPMMTRPTKPIRSESGIMGMGYGFASDENPTPPNTIWAQTPSKYDGNASLAPSSGCNFITIMPSGGKKANLSPVTNCK